MLDEHEPCERAPRAPRSVCAAIAGLRIISPSQRARTSGRARAPPPAGRTAAPPNPPRDDDTGVSLRVPPARSREQRLRRDVSRPGCRRRHGHGALPPRLDGRERCISRGHRTAQPCGAPQGAPHDRRRRRTDRHHPLHSRPDHDPAVARRQCGAGVISTAGRRAANGTAADSCAATCRSRGRAQSAAAHGASSYAGRATNDACRGATNGRSAGCRSSGAARARRAGTAVCSVGARRIHANVPGAVTALSACISAAGYSACSACSATARRVRAAVRTAACTTAGNPSAGSGAGRFHAHVRRSARAGQCAGRSAASDAAGARAPRGTASSTGAVDAGTTTAAGEHAVLAAGADTSIGSAGSVEPDESGEAAVAAAAVGTARVTRVGR